MIASEPSADEASIVGRDRVRHVMQGVLRAANRDWTDEALEAASGIKARAIKAYRVEGKEMPLSAALSLAVVLGARALNPLLATIGYVARPLDEAEQLHPMQIVADSLRHFSTIASAASDGRIDHTEQPSCQEAADMIIATVLPLSSAGKAA
ncbi:hypothetical protein [Sphingomonas solaris]|uniref:Uncharacterized protein n=1 Tax=Alterirhizorhabdus solaris TaxID=2529389 RepID=A0A558R851_9SPHN|nr:hypothetical protein [Sphingomonas solaris]TVV75569.1 hypothetical protein FOY91_06830 [Sphingomonas solaris]